MLKKEEIHFFNDIAYYHVPFTHCPTGDGLREKLKCHCNPSDNFDWKGYSCKFCSTIPRILFPNSAVAGTSRFFDLNKMDKPEGWQDQST